jgi:hypothetical protein
MIADLIGDVVRDVKRSWKVLLRTEISFLCFTGLGLSLLNLGRRFEILVEVLASKYLVGIKLERKRAAIKLV